MAKGLPAGIRRLFRLRSARPNVDADVDEELRFHFEEAVCERMESGLTREEALAQVRAQFGDLDTYRRELERVGARRERQEWWRDLLAGGRASLARTARSARHDPALTIGIVLTLALGVGLNATMFGVVERLMLQPPRHLEDASELRSVLLEESGQGPSGETITRDLSNYPDYAALTDSEGMQVTAYTEPFEMMIGRGLEAYQAQVAGAFPGFFEMLGVQPEEGRFFGTVGGARDVAVVSAEHWGAAMGEDPRVVGRGVEIAGRVHTIVGVAPAGFTGVGLERVDFWVPLEIEGAASWVVPPLPPVGFTLCITSRRCQLMKTVARLGVATQAAEGEATRLVRHARTEDGEDAAPVRVRFGSIIEAARAQVGSGQIRLTFWLVGVSLAVLLLATVNVANLLTARSIQQRTESAVRMALGATRTRVVAEAAAEAATLGVVGTVLALAVARWGGEVIRSTLLPEVYFPASGFTGRLLVFTGVTAVAAGIVASIAPAWHGTRGMFSRWLKHAAPGHSPARSKLSVVLTNIQAAVCVVLVTGAGLFVRSVSEVRSVDLGLDVGQLLQATLVFTDPHLDDHRTIALHEEASRRVASLPEVASAAATTNPLGLVSSVPLSVPGLDSIPDLPGGGPYVRYVSPEYFETTGADIVRGRAIEAGDPPTVAVVSETMADALWAGRDPLGACMRLYGGQACTTVVGVSEDAAHTGFQDEPFMAFYLPQDGESPYQAIYVRAEGDAAEMVGAVAATLRSFSPLVRTARVETLEDLLDPQVRSWRIGAVLFSLFGVLAVSLSGIGLFAVLAYDVSGRTREIGIRSALGAGRMHLLGDMLKKGMQMTGIGLIFGLVAVYFGAPYARELLFQVSPRDPVVLATVVALVLTVTVAGSLLPGVRAVRVSPVEPLKAD